MKKITDFIVDKRYIILGVFVILTIIATICSTKVEINDDITKYLPSTSKTRIGMNIMEDNFKEIESSSLNVMFAHLSDEEKQETLKYLINIDGVSSVDYDKSEDYNKNNYTLYVVNIDDVDDSKLASNVYNNIITHFKDQEIYTSGEVAQANEQLLPTWIIVVAVLCVVVILTIMCESYIEPFLFLLTILMAIILNNGTNIIFNNVSNITSSIAAILQLALSMDYSIMLMDRYRQKKKKESNKIKAMKGALYEAFTAIASSSLTTIVGLLVLIFMSFTIGRDLGLVLAKGVLFSLICIFFVLPSLILIFDKLITKTKKKIPNIKLNKVGAISYKFRYVAIILFIVIFVASYILKGNLSILYTTIQEDKISEVFNENNQMVLIYKTKDENIISDFLVELEEKDELDNVLSYSNTINRKYKVDELNQEIKDLGSDINIDEYLLKILYYNYYNQNENNTMTFNEFTKFIKNEILKSKDISKNIDDDIISSINRLENFTDKTLINKKRSSKKIANILEMDYSDVNNLLTYYASKNNSLKLSLPTFINFINKEVLTDKTYANSIDKEAKNSLNTLTKFANKKTITKKISSKKMASLLNMDESTINSLYAYYLTINDIDLKISLNDFANFVLNDVINDSKYTSYFNNDTINNLKILATFSNQDIINQKMDAKTLANLFNIDEESVKQVLLLKYNKKDNGTTLTKQEFKIAINTLKNNNYLDNLDISVYDLSDNTTKYSATELASILSINPSEMYQIYALIDYVNNNTSKWTSTPKEFVSLLLNTKLDTSTKTNLEYISNIINNANNTYTYQELAKYLNMDSSLIKNIYTLYTISNNDYKLTPQELVNFLIENKNDELLANNLDENTLSNLKLLQKIINSVSSNTKYSSKEISKLLGMKEENISLLYGLYSSKHSNIKISLKEFVSFILDDVLNNKTYASNFTKDNINKLNTIDEVINSSLNNTKYTKENLFKILNNLGGSLDQDLIDLIYIYYGSVYLYNDNYKLTIEQFVNYLNYDILQDSRFDSFIDDDMSKSLESAKQEIDDSKDLLIGKDYGRVILNANLPLESSETFKFLKNIKDDLSDKVDEFYIIGDSSMAYEMSETFGNELNFITILTMIAIFIVVALTFKSFILPLILVLIINCSVYTTMSIIALSGEGVYFIALLIVQSILMGATIDYAILYSTYYIEHRKKHDIKNSIIKSYNKSINTILTSSSILIIATFVISLFSSGIISQITLVLAEGTLCATLLILILLPAILGVLDRFVIKRKIK